jgi:hypothetical protein
MSNTDFDRVETSLKDLKEIVDISHAQSAETARLVADMEVLIAEMKSKAHTEPRFQKIIDAAPIVLVQSQAAVPV